MPPAGTSGSRMDACRLVKGYRVAEAEARHPVAIGPDQAEQTSRARSARWRAWPYY